MQNHIFEILKDLSDNDVDYVICGGIACVLQGCERTTFDLDLNIFLDDQKNLERAISVFIKNKFVPRIPEPIQNLLNPENRRKWREEKNALVYTVQSAEGMIQVDIFLSYPIAYPELKKNSDVFEFGGCSFFVSSREDLVRAKQAVCPVRQKDIDDIKNLEMLIKNGKK